MISKIVINSCRLLIICSILAMNSAFANPDSLYLSIPQALPKLKNSFIERAEKGEAPSGFKIRGMKGWSWTPEQYLEEIPILSKYKMNFLMNCYLSMFSQPLMANSDVTWKNEWWLPIPESKKRIYEKIFKECKDRGINFCFALNPQLFSPRPLDPTSSKDFEDIYQHYEWAQQNGVRWFSVSLDDVSGVKISGEEHVRFVNKVLQRLRLKDPGAQMVFCPTFYGGDGRSSETEITYLASVAKDLDPSVYLFWTGPSDIQNFTLKDAQAYTAMVKHKVIYWENYPVNDGTLTLHLAPIHGRDKDLCNALDGYMVNPFFRENEINRIPLFTTADYTYAPKEYIPSTSISQAIIHQTDNKEQQKVLLQLVELYSSKILEGGVGFNPVINRFKQIIGNSYSEHFADEYLLYVKEVRSNLQKLFPKRYMQTKITIDKNIKTMEDDYLKRYGVPFPK